jgi:hypothetical protein
MGFQVRSRLAATRDRIKRQLRRSNPSLKSHHAQPAAALPEMQVLAQQLPQGGAGALGRGVGVVSAAPNVATVADFGPVLVELIEATISPATWNINGGNSSIVYYAPLHVLVVSAPDEVHAQVGDAIGQLRAAQRQVDGVQVVAEVDAVRAAK